MLVGFSQVISVAGKQIFTGGVEPPVSVPVTGLAVEVGEVPAAVAEAGVAQHHTLGVRTTEIRPRKS